MSIAAIMKIDEVQVIDRGSGIKTWPLAVHQRLPEAKFTTGISSYPRGKGAPLHWHNCDEQVTLLSGIGEVEVDGEVSPLKPYDSTYIAAGRKHRFTNKGDEPMVILWVYSSMKVTRTFASDGIEVEHLSAADLMGDAPAKI